MGLSEKQRSLWRSTHRKLSKNCLRVSQSTDRGRAVTHKLEQTHKKVLDEIYQLTSPKMKK